MGDFNARHTELGDMSTLNTNGRQLFHCIQRNHLTRWETRGATHAHGGTLDHIVTFGLVEAHFNCTSIAALFSDHVALAIQYSIPARHTSPHHRPRINIPPKFCPNYIDYMTAVSPTFDKTSPEALYTSLVTETQSFIPSMYPDSTYKDVERHHPGL